MRRAELEQLTRNGDCDRCAFGLMEDCHLQCTHMVCDDDYDDERFPDDYAEVEYDDFDDPEAVIGARWDDMNYLRYSER